MAPARPHPGRELQFRGTRTAPPRWTVDGASLSVGPWFINGDSSDRLIVSSIVGDRVQLGRPGEWEALWTPLDLGSFGTYDSVGGSDSRMRISEERLREIPVDGLFEHPVWPPPRGGDLGPGFQHQVWPPAWFKGDTGIIIANVRGRRPSR